MTQFVLFFCNTQWLEVLERTWFFSFIKATSKQYLRCLPECLFIQRLFLLFLRTMILFWCSKVHRLRLILPTKYLILSNLRSQHADSVILRNKWVFMHLYIIRNITNTKIIYKSYQGTTSSRSAQFSKFWLSEGTKVYWKSKSSLNLTRNKSLELVLEYNAKALTTLLLHFLVLVCSFIYRESSFPE